MPYTSAEARQQLLDVVAVASEKLGLAVASLGAAYEQLDTYSAERLEQELFRPVQLAYGRARRTSADFADRHGLQPPPLEPGSPGLPSKGARGFIESAVQAVDEADAALAELQDSMLTVEVGDAELRAGLADVRELVATLSAAARLFLRSLGR